MLDKATVEQVMQDALLWFEQWREELEAQWEAQERDIENVLALTAAKQFMAQTPPDVHQALAAQDPIEYQRVQTLAQQEYQKPQKSKRGGK